MLVFRLLHSISKRGVWSLLAVGDSTYQVVHFSVDSIQTVAEDANLIIFAAVCFFLQQQFIEELANATQFVQSRVIAVLHNQLNEIAHIHQKLLYAHNATIAPDGENAFRAKVTVADHVAVHLILHLRQLLEMTHLILQIGLVPRCKLLDIDQRLLLLLALNLLLGLVHIKLF
jgi:hypothetical protein